MKKYVKIDGIHCSHCESKITNALLKNKKIEKVSIKNNIAHITYNGNLTNKEIINTIISLPKGIPFKPLNSETMPSTILSTI